MESVGLHKVSLIDFPGEVAAVLFFPGCNLRCPYCHNPGLVAPPFPADLIPIDDAFRYLEKRKNVLGGVVLSGGEPLLHQGIADVIARVRSLGLRVKIDTNGTRPEVLRSLDVDFIAMDIKTSFDKYGPLGGERVSDLKSRLADSVKYIINSTIPHEFRMVAVPHVVDLADLPDICESIKGAQRFMIARFRPETTLDPAFRDVLPYPPDMLKRMKAVVESSGIACAIR